MYLEAKFSFLITMFSLLMNIIHKSFSCLRNISSYKINNAIGIRMLPIKILLLSEGCPQHGSCVRSGSTAQLHN